MIGSWDLHSHITTKTHQNTIDTTDIIASIREDFKQLMIAKGKNNESVVRSIDDEVLRLVESTFKGKISPEGKKVLEEIINSKVSKVSENHNEMYDWFDKHSHLLSVKLNSWEIPIGWLNEGYNMHIIFGYLAFKQLVKVSFSFGIFLKS